MSPVNLVAFAGFLAAWIGYTFYADSAARTRSLMGAASRHRAQWMESMLARDNRIVDATVVATLARSVLFFAQTSIFIIAGLLATFGAVDRIGALLAEVPIASPGTLRELHIKVALLIGVFIYSFFKFTWSMRLFNYLSVLVGAAPAHDAPRGGDRDAVIDRAARLGDLAVDHFNRGIRGYYFGLAVLSWFLDPWLFMAVTLWVVAVLWRREFRSDTLSAMSQ